jgi:hypothetical protein
MANKMLIGEKTINVCLSDLILFLFLSCEKKVHHTPNKKLVVKQSLTRIQAPIDLMLLLLLSCEMLRFRV